MRQRWQVYVQHIGSMAPNAIVQDRPLITDTDAPFVLTSRALRVKPDPAITGYQNAAAVALSTRWRNARGDYVSREWLNAQVDMPFSGSWGGNPSPVQPPEIYAPGSPISADVKNATLNNETFDVYLYYFGMKLFPGENPTYPKRCSVQRYWHNGGSVTSLPISQPETGPPKTVIFRVASDADYVIRGGQCGSPTVTPTFPSTFHRFKNVTMVIKDMAEKPYMNAPVDVKFLWGSADVDTVNSGPWHPGLCVPELYLHAQDYLYIDWFRDDTGFSNTPAQDIQLVFFGSKVFLQ